jgi:hypothetical protein
MPYIKKDLRLRLDYLLKDYLHHESASNAGELNYTITIILHKYFTDNGCNYQAINDIVGALEGAKLEFYRRIASTYEDTKIKSNGDVFHEKE